MTGRGAFGSESGTALLITLLIMSLLAGLGGALVFLMDVETAISANYRHAQELRYAADAGLECAMAELRIRPDWSVALAAASGGTAARCTDSAAPARTIDGTPLDLARLTAARQGDSDLRYGAPASNPDSPRWEPFSQGRLTAGGRDGPSTRPYVVVWVADDVDDGDHDPRQDANGVVLLRAQAFGYRGGRAGVEALVARDAGPPAGVRVIGWREVR
jgi:hypothetical protein